MSRFYTLGTATGRQVSVQLQGPPGGLPLVGELVNREEGGMWIRESNGTMNFVPFTAIQKMVML